MTNFRTIAVIATAIIASAPAATASLAQSPWLPQPTVQAGGGWTKVSFMINTRRPPPGLERLAALLERYGPRQTRGLPGLAVTYAVIATPAGRTVMATTANDAACEPAPNGAAAKLAPDQCPTHVIRIASSGQIQAQTLAAGCYLWVEPDLPSPDHNANATYVRAVSGQIEARTLVDGRPVSACRVAVPF